MTSLISYKSLQVTTYIIGALELLVSLIFVALCLSLILHKSFGKADFIVCVGLFLNLISSIFLLVGANIQLPELVLTLIAITCFSTGILLILSIGYLFLVMATDEPSRPSTYFLLFGIPLLAISFTLGWLVVSTRRSKTETRT